MKTITGPWRAPINDAADRTGSIHDDATARQAGFRGGTVAGSIHLDQFVPLLLDAFGRTWFETGSLSIYFRHATVDREPVQACCDRPSTSEREQVRAWMTTEDGTIVAEGTASAGTTDQPTALADRDLRAGDPDELHILRLRPGDRFETPIRLDGRRQRMRMADGAPTEPLDWYTGGSPWGGAIASPWTVIDLFTAAGGTGFAGSIGPAVAMYGALEVRHLNGPMLLDADYQVHGEVVAVGQSPKTEYLWWDGTAVRDGVDVASMRMMSRYLK